MSLPYEQVYNNFTDDLKPAFDRWCEDAKRIEKGGNVINNIKSERQLGIGEFTEFLGCIARSYQDFLSTDPQNADPKSAYENVCKEYRFQGKKSQVSISTILHHVLNEKDLKEIIRDAMDYDDPEEAWDDFWNEDISNEYRMEYLADAGFYPPKETVWAYFNEEDAEEGTMVDPLVGKNANECCAKLGLPPEWNKYAYGEPIWKLHYSPSRAIPRHIPTIADAEWNPYFQPEAESRENAKWGWTRPLGTHRGTKGMPEAVHRAWKSGIEQGAFYRLPDRLGER